MTNQVNNSQQMDGFVAGTLVHTKEGLVPIEKLKVGDYVLSKDESGEGVQSFQRITQTFVHEVQEVLCLDISGHTEKEAREANYESPLDKSKYFPLIVTPNHPFWVVGKGWIDAERLVPAVDNLEFSDESRHFVSNKSRIIRTLEKDIGWLIRGVFCPIVFSENVSRTVDLSNNAITSSYDRADRIENEGVEWWEEHEQDRMRRTVYNIEVENTHTYYVGELGVWVHNTYVKDNVNIEISIQNQTLTLFDSAGNVKAHYSISTAANGAGCVKKSECTPLGAHVIRAKIGASAQPNAVFVGRRLTGEICTPELMAQFPERDWILTRILWLSGTEIGKNRLGNVDSMQRYIYIHGTPDSEPMGEPRSHGCVRMRNTDVMTLFELVKVGTRVLIK